MCVRWRISLSLSLSRSLSRALSFGQGICDLNETVLAEYSPGCRTMVDNPLRLFLYVIPATHANLLEPFVRAVMHRKAYELGMAPTI